MLLAQKSPSLNWEPILLDPAGQFAVWAWFRPAAIPGGLMIVVPAALFAIPTMIAKLSMRQLVAATGIEAAQILGWSVNGMNFSVAGGHSPLLDQLLPPPPPGSDVNLTVWMEIPQPISWQEVPNLSFPGPHAAQTATQPIGYQSPGDEQSFAAIESSWNSIRQLESKVGMMRKQLEQSVSRLNSLNRDLSPDERRTCDNKDKQDWIEARRWLRDSLGTLSRSVKEIDVGTTSGAGQRHKFEDIFLNFVAPRIPFAGLEQSVIDFEIHIKSLQNVLAAAQTGLTRAGRDAEQRASSVLQRVGAKMRSVRR